MAPGRRVWLAVLVVVGALVVLDVVAPRVMRALPAASPLVAAVIVAAVVAYVAGTILAANGLLRVRLPARRRRLRAVPPRSAADFIEEFERRHRS